MDEVQVAFYRLRFREAFLEKKGTEFQDWFVRLAGHAFGADFEAVRAYGKYGDLKCDGRRLSTRTIFQCYAPYQQTAAELDSKIASDFHGACVHWDTWMNEWVLVHNDTRGLPPTSIQLLDALRRDHPHVTTEVWTEPKLQELAAVLPLSAQQDLFGYAPSKTGVETLMMEDLKPGQPHIKSLSHQYLISEVVVQCCPDTLLSDADFGCFTFEKIHRDMSNHPHIMGSIASANPTLVFSKRDVQTPM